MPVTFAETDGEKILNAIKSGDYWPFLLIITLLMTGWRASCAERKTAAGDTNVLKELSEEQVNEVVVHKTGMCPLHLSVVEEQARCNALQMQPCLHHVSSDTVAPQEECIEVLVARKAEVTTHPLRVAVRCREPLTRGLRPPCPLADPGKNSRRPHSATPRCEGGEGTGRGAVSWSVSFLAMMTDSVLWRGGRIRWCWFWYD